MKSLDHGSHDDTFEHSPIPIKRLRISPIDDTGAAINMIKDNLSSDTNGMPTLIAFEDLVNRSKSSYVRLARPVLVRLTLARHDEQLQIVCDSREIRTRSIRLSLPCSLGLKPGAEFDMEIFLREGEEPARVHGEVEHVEHINNEDVVRFAVDVQFTRASGVVEDSIEDFIQSAACLRQPHLPA